MLTNSNIFQFRTCPRQSPEQKIMQNHGAEEEEGTLEVVLGDLYIIYTDISQLRLQPLCINPYFSVDLVSLYNCS